MEFFNDSLASLMGKKSSASVYGTSETDNAMDCPECCSLIIFSWWTTVIIAQKTGKCLSKIAIVFCRDM